MSSAAALAIAPPPVPGAVLTEGHLAYPGQSPSGTAVVFVGVGEAAGNAAGGIRHGWKGRTTARARGLATSRLAVGARALRRSGRRFRGQVIQRAGQAPEVRHIG
ncbi:MAG: hypothetical protein ACRDNZ_13140 [Streptosporangiaceae bacterium]